MHEKRIDIRWRDLDPLGHVNQAVYLTFLEEVLDDWFRDALRLDDARTWDYVAAKTTIEYRNELRLTDSPVIGSARVLRVGRSSVVAQVELRRGDGEIAAEAEVVVVARDPETRRSRPVTDDERALLSAASE